MEKSKRLDKAASSSEQAALAPDVLDGASSYVDDGTLLAKAELQRKISVVCVSRPDLALETELTARSIDVFLQGQYQLILLGEDLDKDILGQLSGKVVNIPFSFTDDVIADDMEIAKFLTACDEITDDFILFPSKCWLIDRINIAHIQVAKYSGLLQDTLPGYKETTAAYMGETLNALNAVGYPFSIIDCRTGYPVFLQKMYLADAIELACDKEVDILTVYGNSLRAIQHPILLRLEDEWGLNVKNSNVSEAVFTQHVIHKCFLRTEADRMPKMLEDYVRGMFDEDDDK